MPMKIGSSEWCQHWATFYRKRAVSFSRVRNDLEETLLFYALFEAEYWATLEPWA